MLFLFTMHMPSFSGHLIHQVIGEYPVNSLEDMTDVVCSSDFIIVNEYYKGDDGKSKMNGYYPKGPVSLNCMNIGKIKEFSA